MIIGILGAGRIGGTIAGRLSADGHEVRLANSRGPATIRDVANDDLLRLSREIYL